MSWEVPWFKAGDKGPCAAGDTAASLCRVLPVTAASQCGLRGFAVAAFTECGQVFPDKDGFGWVPQCSLSALLSWLSW